MRSGRGCADLLIGDHDTRLDSLRLQKLVRWDRCMQTRFTENEALDPGMAAAIFRLSRPGIFMQTLPSREQGEHKVTSCLLEADQHGSRNWIEEQAACSPRWGMKEGVKVHAWLRRA